MSEKTKILIHPVNNKRIGSGWGNNSADDISLTYSKDSLDFIRSASSGSFDILQLKGFDALSETLRSVKNQSLNKSFLPGSQTGKRRLKFLKSSASDLTGADISSDIKQSKEHSDYPGLKSSELQIVSKTAATLSHEINNPLMTISANTEMILNRGYDLDKDIEEKIRIIASMADRIRNVTSKLMNLDRLEYRNMANGQLINPDAQITKKPVNNTPLHQENRLKNISLDKPDTDHILVKRS